MCTSFVIKDASANEEYQEEEFCTKEEEEEEEFNNCTNQGKLYQCKLLSMQAMLVQASKDTIEIYLFRELYQSQVLSCKLLILNPFIVNFCLSLE